jgi:broad specificity phosphatase PhoE
VLTTTFVRHGESVWNDLGLIQGQASAPGLSPTGWQQAEQTALWLRRLSADLLLSSDLARARETADVVSGVLGVPVRVDARLRERHLGVLQGLPVAAVDPLLYGVANGRVADPDVAPAGGETFRQFDWRVRSVLRDLIHSMGDATVLLVTHGGFIRMAKGCHEGSSLRGMPWSEVPNGAYWRVTWSAQVDAVKMSERRTEYLC